ncbi:MAG: hypothetical protein H0X24_22570 [Ktedonobacterales bacterium]|nr:hypothetical protein [Ktedonobacterales bacterium]
MADGLVISVEAQGLRDMLGRFASFNNPDALLRANGLMTEAGALALEIAREYAPKDSGTFAAGLSLREYGDVGFAVVSDNAQVLGFLRDGTASNGTGRIYPISARALIFDASRWRKAPIPPSFGGRYAFSSVRGQAASPWEGEAMSAILEQVRPILNSAASQWVNQIGYGHVEG